MLDFEAIKLFVLFNVDDDVDDDDDGDLFPFDVAF